MRLFNDMLHVFLMSWHIIFDPNNFKWMMIIMPSKNIASSILETIARLFEIEKKEENMFSWLVEMKD